MKKLTRSALVFVLVMVLAALSSCTDKKTTEITGVMGDDAMMMAFIKPIDVLSSCGASIEGGKLVMPRSFKRLLGGDAETPNLSKLRGIDYELIGFAVYSKLPDYELICTIKDAGDFAASLKKLGFDKDKIEGHVVFVNEDERMGVVVAGNLGIMFPCYHGDVADYVETVTERASEPISAWKADLMARRSSSSIYGLAVSPTSKVDYSVAYSAKLDGARMTVETECFDLDGKSTTWTHMMEDDIELATLGDEVKYISKDCLYGFAVAGLKNMSLQKLVDKYGNKLPYMNSFRYVPEEYLKALNGGFFASVGMVDPSSRRYDNYKNYTATAGVTTIDDRGERMLKNLVSMARDNGLTVRTEGDGYMIRMDEMGSAMVECTDGVIHATYGDVSNSRMSASSVDGCIAWMGVNIPENFGLLKEYRISYGFKCDLRVKPTVSELSLEIIGSDKPFLESLIEIAQRVN